MNFTEHSLKLFYDSLYKDEYLIVGVIEDGDIVSNLFKDSLAASNESNNWLLIE